MKTTRLESKGGHYHVMSRIIERRFYLGEEEKEVFCRMMRRAAEFSGVKILTHCVMSNHFHILIEVPEHEEIGHDELLRRLKVLYTGNDLLDAEHWKDDQKMLEGVKARYALRMYDLSEFMKTLKQRFSFWYNKSHDRSGPLWNGRFKSVLVESPHRNDQGFGNRAIMTMAAYIDLNPVRAGLVDDPKDYRWCGYGEAVAGKPDARLGLGLLIGFLDGKVAKWEGLAQRYRVQLFLVGEGQQRFSSERVQQVLDRGGILSKRDMMHCRVRYFSDGFVLGSKAFVDDVFEMKRGHFSPRRTSGARRMRGGEWDDLCVARDLRLNVIGVSAT